MNSAQGSCACAARSRSNATSCSASSSSPSISYSEPAPSRPPQPDALIPATQRQAEKSRDRRILQEAHKNGDLRRQKLNALFQALLCHRSLRFPETGTRGMTCRDSNPCSSPLAFCRVHAYVAGTLVPEDRVAQAMNDLFGAQSLCSASVKLDVERDRRRPDALPILGRRNHAVGGSRLSSRRGSAAIDRGLGRLAREWKPTK